MMASDAEIESLDYMEISDGCGAETDTARPTYITWCTYPGCSWSFGGGDLCTEAFIDHFKHTHRK